LAQAVLAHLTYCLVFVGHAVPVKRSPMQHWQVVTLLFLALPARTASVSAGLRVARAHSGSGSPEKIDQLQRTISFLSVKLERLEAQHQRSLIEPDLDPKSHNKFFKKDYPNDLRPKVVHEFDHPFPTVQEDADYDKDYVKDANKDGGEWAAQTKYDAAVTKLAKEKDDLKKALEKEQQEESDLEEAKQKEKDAEAKAKAEEKEAEAARKKADEAKTAALEAEKKNGTVGNATDTVEKEVADLENCKKQLEEAKEKLKEVMATEGKDDAEVAEASSEEAAAKESTVKAEQAEAGLEAELKQEEAEHIAALKSSDEEKADVDKAEAELKSAADNLRRFRKDVDQDGGIYRSSARAASAGAALLAVLLLN